ncbi:MAG: LytTR family transcriptional regulator [Solobacterium sp.]|nr:LytTR family transcriptional regulator [Solobacterium sp.]
MKIQLSIPEAQYEQVKKELEEHGIEVSDRAEYVLNMRGQYSGWLSVRKDREQTHIPVSSVIYIESLGHDVLVHTAEGVYNSSDRLVQLEKTLDPALFLRVSNSVIIAKKHVKRITAAFTRKFILTMSDGSIADVTRSYYDIFRQEFGI